MLSLCNFLLSYISICKSPWFWSSNPMHFCRLYQVTWLEKTGFIYDRNNLSKVCTSPFLLCFHSRFCSFSFSWFILNLISSKETANSSIKSFQFVPILVPYSILKLFILEFIYCSLSNISSIAYTMFRGRNRGKMSYVDLFTKCRISNELWTSVPPNKIIAGIRYYVIEWWNWISLGTSLTVVDIVLLVLALPPSRSS